MYNPTNPGYSTQNQTRLTPNYEPTVSANPYAYSPYDLQNVPTPPPPPKERHTGLRVVLVSILCLIVILSGVFFAVVHFSPLQQGKAQALPTSVTTTPTVLLTAVPTPTSTITQINYNPNAVDIYNDIAPQFNPATHHVYSHRIWMLALLR